jgi:hypothetical protein
MFAKVEQSSLFTPKRNLVNYFIKSCIKLSQAAYTIKPFMAVINSKGSKLGHCQSLSP